MCAARTGFGLLHLDLDYFKAVNDTLGHAAGDFVLETVGRILRELISRTSLVLMTFSADHASEREEATACGCREHRMLLDAIRLRDAREAAHLMAKHLDLLESRLQFQPAVDESLDLLSVLAG